MATKFNKRKHYLDEAEVETALLPGPRNLKELFGWHHDDVRSLSAGEKSCLHANLLACIGVASSYSGARTFEAACEFLEHAVKSDCPQIADQLATSGFHHLGSCDIGAVPKLIARRWKSIIKPASKSHHHVDICAGTTAEGTIKIDEALRIARDHTLDFDLRCSKLEEFDLKTQCGSDHMSSSWLLTKHIAAIAIISALATTSPTWI